MPPPPLPPLLSPPSSYGFNWPMPFPPLAGPRFVKHRAGTRILKRGKAGRIDSPIILALLFVCSSGKKSSKTFVAHLLGSDFERFFLLELAFLGTEYFFWLWSCTRSRLTGLLSVLGPPNGNHDDGHTFFLLSPWDSQICAKPACVCGHHLLLGGVGLILIPRALTPATHRKHL